MICDIYGDVVDNNFFSWHVLLSSHFMHFFVTDLQWIQQKCEGAWFSRCLSKLYKDFHKYNSVQRVTGLPLDKNWRDGLVRSVTCSSEGVVHQILALASSLFLSVSVVVSGTNHAGGGDLLSMGIAPECMSIWRSSKLYGHWSVFNKNWYF
jgi:hypothetical protein